MPGASTATIRAPPVPPPPVIVGDFNNELARTHPLYNIREEKALLAFGHFRLPKYDAAHAELVGFEQGD